MRSHVGLVSQWYDPERGSAAQPGVIARSLVESGHKVDVVTGFPNYPDGKLYDGYTLRPYQREDHGPVRVHRSALYPSHDTNTLRRSATYLSFAAGASAVALRQLKGVDVILVFASPATAAVPAMVLRAFSRVPYVVHIHDLWPDSVLSSGFLQHWQSRSLAKGLHGYCDRMYRGAGAVAVTSPGMADRIAARGVPRPKIHFIPNWADEKLFRPMEVDPSARAALGLGRPTTVMYAGNLGEYQDLHTVIRAAALLQDRTDIEFVFIGEGVQRASLEREVERLRLSNVKFLGQRPISQMPGLLALGDLQIVSLLDRDIFAVTLPSKLVATLASGRPILGALTGDAAAVVEACGAGEVVTPGMPRELAAAVIRFAGLSPEERRRRGAQGHAYYQSHLARDTVAARLSHLLDDVGSAGQTGVVA